jgi:hypothetical protein
MAVPVGGDRRGDEIGNPIGGPASVQLQAWVSGQNAVGSRREASLFQVDKVQEHQDHLHQRLSVMQDALRGRSRRQAGKKSRKTDHTQLRLSCE